jgi:hypothetical protein
MRLDSAQPEFAIPGDATLRPQIGLNSPLQAAERLTAPLARGFAPRRVNAACAKSPQLKYVMDPTTALNGAAVLPPHECPNNDFRSTSNIETSARKPVGLSTLFANLRARRANNDGLPPHAYRPSPRKAPAGPKPSKPEQFRANSSRVEAIDNSREYKEVLKNVVRAIHRNDWDAPVLQYGYMHEHFSGDDSVPTLFDFLYAARERGLLRENHFVHAYDYAAATLDVYYDRSAPLRSNGELKKDWARLQDGNIKNDDPLSYFSQVRNNKLIPPIIASIAETPEYSRLVSEVAAAVKTKDFQAAVLHHGYMRHRFPDTPTLPSVRYLAWFAWWRGELSQAEFETATAYLNMSEQFGAQGASLYRTTHKIRQNVSVGGKVYANVMRAIESDGTALQIANEFSDAIKSRNFAAIAELDIRCKKRKITILEVAIFCARRTDENQLTFAQACLGSIWTELYRQVEGGEAPRPYPIKLDERVAQRRCISSTPALNKLVDQLSKAVNKGDWENPIFNQENFYLKDPKIDETFTSCGDCPTMADVAALAFEEGEICSTQLQSSLIWLHLKRQFNGHEKEYATDHHNALDATTETTWIQMPIFSSCTIEIHEFLDNSGNFTSHGADYLSFINEHKDAPNNLEPGDELANELKKKPHNMRFLFSIKVDPKNSSNTRDLYSYLGVAKRECTFSVYNEKNGVCNIRIPSPGARDIFTVAQKSRRGTPATEGVQRPMKAGAAKTARYRLAAHKHRAVRPRILLGKTSAKRRAVQYNADNRQPTIQCDEQVKDNFVYPHGILIGAFMAPDHDVGYHTDMSTRFSNFAKTFFNGASRNFIELLKTNRRSPDHATERGRDGVFLALTEEESAVATAAQERLIDLNFTESHPLSDVLMDIVIDSIERDAVNGARLADLLVKLSFQFTFLDAISKYKFPEMYREAFINPAIDSPRSSIVGDDDIKDLVDLSHGAKNIAANVQHIFIHARDCTIEEAAALETLIASMLDSKVLLSASAYDLADDIVKTMKEYGLTAPEGSPLWEMTKRILSRYAAK